LKVIQAYPPNIVEIRAAFNISGRAGIVFAYGDTIFNPSGRELPKEIVVHEEVHGERQGQTPRDWWTRYIADKAFRLEEELYAHRMEYIALLSQCGPTPSRAMRRRLLRHVASKLASPLYKNMVNLENAKRLIDGKEPIKL